MTITIDDFKEALGLWSLEDFKVGARETQLLGRSYIYSFPDFIFKLIKAGNKDERSALLWKEALEPERLKESMAFLVTCMARVEISRLISVLLKILEEKDKAEAILRR